jgi:hypothetical protein
LIFLALLMLPTFLVFAPQKLSMLLNLGSICVLSSIAVLKGGFYQYFIKDLLFSEPTRRLYAIAYYVSILLSLYVSLILKSYLLTLIAMIAEIIILLYFVCSSFPGGHTGLNYMGSLIWSTLKSCFKVK